MEYELATVISKFTACLFDCWILHFSFALYLISQFGMSIVPLCPADFPWAFDHLKHTFVCISMNSMCVV